MVTKVKLLIEIPQKRLEVLRAFKKNCPEGLGSSDKIILAGKVYEKPKTGRWIEEINDYGEIMRWHCDKCYEDSGFTTNCKYDFCPNCGAKMQEVEE